jgi:putative nucleotidyltransferase with HDIG domain
MVETIMERAKRIVEKIGELPSMPVIIMKVMSMLNDPSTTVKDIQTKVLLDQALTVFILKVANSPLYGLKKEVKTISYAINLLGFNKTKSLLMTYLAKVIYQKRGKKMIKNVLWKHAIAAGVFGRNIAKYIRTVNLEETFIACLLHDIGKSVLLMSKPDEFERAVELVFNDGKSSYESENIILTYSHVETGFLLLKKWELSQETIEGVVFHHNYQDYYGESKIVAIVSLANKLCHKYGYSFVENEQEYFELKLLKIPLSVLGEIVITSKQEIEDYIELTG